MTRIVTFALSLLAIILVLNFRNHHGEHPQERFDFEKARSLHEKKIEELEKLTAPKEVAKVQEVKKEGPLVELTTPELQRGSELYKKCIACHGVAGEGKKAQNAPKIGGQYDWYVTLQINNMKNKVRINKVMDPYVSRLSEQDMKDLGTYISKLPW
ncbi:MAG: hypothetical protein Fur0010_15930 [Bdellovibrio sp.]